MRIAYVTAGAADMYCGSCLHDNTLAAALSRSGHEVALVPTYTPIRTDETDVSIDRVFYGAIGVYLDQRSALLRRAPRLLGRLLGHPRLLGWLTRGRASIDPRQLGALTLSVLQGENGNQARDLKLLVDWLREFKPDLVHLTNSMFLGLAAPIRREIGVPVLCALQGEDLFLERLVEPYRSRVVAALRERSRDVNGFVATSRDYVARMAELLDVHPMMVHHVPLGVKLDGFGVAKKTLPERPFVVGYLARVAPEKGLRELVEGFARLAERAGKEHVRLEIAGWLGNLDRPYLDGVMEDATRRGLADIVHYRGEVNRRQKIEFLDAIHVLSVPTTYREPKGLFVLEAWASGVPVVQPRHGAFPEMIEATGGGLLFEPGSADELAHALGRLMNEPALREDLGRRGRAAVEADFTDARMAERTLEVYRGYLG